MLITPDGKKYLSFPEAGELAGLNRHSVRYHADRGVFGKVARIEHKNQTDRYIDEKEIEAWIKERKKNQSD